MASVPSAASSDFTLIRVRGASRDPAVADDDENVPLSGPLQLEDLTGNATDAGRGCIASGPNVAPPTAKGDDSYTSKDVVRLRNEAKPPEKQPFAKFLSPEEEAMFGQYQAVGLGDETLEEAYAPVPRTYVSPPNGDIYSTFGIVMATFSPHALMLSRFFDSMAKFCLDCHRVRIVLIIPAKEMDLFTNIRDRHIKQLPGIEVVPFSHVFPALNVTLAIDTPGWNAGWTGWDEERLLKAKDKAIFQSFKKVYGCLYLATEYCMLLDSEGFFIRQATLADIYGGYRKSPYLVYSSYLRQRFFATRSAQDLLGYHENYGWALEEYNWVLDTNIIAELERIFRRARPNLEHMEPLVFIEVVYWIYMMHNHHRYPRLRVLDTANLFGIDVLNNMRKQVNFNDDAITVWEDLRWFMEKDPALVDLAVDIFNKNKFKMIKIGKTKESIEFLERATSVVLCVSEQPDELYEMAMKGYFNRTLEPPKKQESQHEEGRMAEARDQKG
ncbi:hypothetical protein BCR44DRAFT_1456272 [Catenaria anguillulae PL171]|uniref:Uncharacterized protein n=1 Tax=Catenaria anguillulae PL171 TaxID=765915 RepID=A0A1Y2GRN6_9FUNG|nr:hypothetical protein BCR44DRAFT_1456272 [Catenaria anguillulae PL171]